MIEQVPLKQIKPNPKNPRTIKDSKFRQLVQSIKEFPDMLKVRPIVVDENMIVLGGNQRLKACREAGLKDIWIINAKFLTPSQQQEFMIKDNTSFGEWDWEVLTDGWKRNDLTTWGIELPQFVDIISEPQIDEDIIASRLQTYINATVKHVSLYFTAQRYEEVLQICQEIADREGLNDNTEVFEFLLSKYEA
jgi:hypothetical protein